MKLAHSCHGLYREYMSMNFCTGDMIWDGKRLYFNNSSSELLFFEEDKVVRKDLLDCRSLRDSLCKVILNNNIICNESDFIGFNDYLKHLTN